MQNDCQRELQGRQATDQWGYALVIGIQDGQEEGGPEPSGVVAGKQGKAAGGACATRTV